jgi:hypothetical protein
MSDGQVIYEIVGDNKKAIEAVKEVTQTVQKEGKKWDQTTAEAGEGISGSLKKAFSVATIAAFTAKAGKMVLDFAKECVNAFSDLEEVQNVVDVTFGESGAAKIDRWAKQAAQSFGLTETQAKRFTSTLGAMMKSAGLSGEEIVDMSTDMAGLAADMASFYNLDFDTAFNKIRSGISGETEPLKQLGINMSQANLQAFALAQGIKKPLDQMSQGEMIMLRYQYLMQATADAQGDFARTSDGYANSVRMLETNLESIKTKIGEVIIPIFADLVQGVNNFLSEITQSAPRTVLDDFAEIEEQTGEKLFAIQAQGNEVRELMQSLRDVSQGFKISFTDEIVDDLGKMGITSKQAEEYLKNLGYTSEEIKTIQQRWLEVCNRLTTTIPGLTEVVDTNTGALKDGIKGVEDWVSAWETGEERAAQIWAIEQKRAALREKYAGIGTQWADAYIAKQRYDKALEQWHGWGGGDTGFDTKGYNGNVHMSGVAATGNTYWAEWNYLKRLENEWQSAQKIYDQSNAALQEGERELQELTNNLDYNTAIELRASDAAKTFANSQVQAASATEDATEAIQTEEQVLEDTLAALNEYADQVYRTIRTTLDNSAHAFDAVETPADKARQRVTDLTSQLEDAQDKGKIQIQIQGAEAEIPTAMSMLNNLTDQLQFLEEYGEKLSILKEKGLSDELLAMLSDGSLESMDYIRALYDNPEMIPEINERYGQVTEAKNSLAQSLAQNQLSVDTQFSTLQESVANALTGLADSQETAYTNAEGVGNSIADGLNASLPGIISAVTSILTALSMLDGVSFPSFGAMGSMGSSFTPTWFDVPKSGGINYETMGQANGDYMTANGNVYLDGRKVGAVINNQNAQEYQNYTRAGVDW